jgi:hypothetical protein
MSKAKRQTKNRSRLVRVTLATLLAVSVIAAPMAHAQGGGLRNLFGGGGGGGLGGGGAGGMGGGAMNLAMLIGLFSMFGGQNQNQLNQPQSNLVEAQGERDKAAREKLQKLDERMKALEAKL